MGTELLLGQIVNSNTSTMGAALAERGIDAHYQQTVGDNLTRIADAIRVAIGRSDAVVMTGGIGPTQDDITREAVCEVTGREMVFSEDYADRLREWWSRRGRAMPQSNLRQAYYPEGAEMLPNPRGTAPGLAPRARGQADLLCPRRPRRDGVPHVRRGSPEAGLGLRGGAGDREPSHPHLGPPRVGGGRDPRRSVHLVGEPFLGLSRIEFGDQDPGHGQGRYRGRGPSLIEPMETEVRSRLGDSVFGLDDETIERVLMQLLSDRGYTVGTAESMTGGMVSARLTDLPGSSAVVGGLVAYDSELKHRLLD